MAAPVLTHRDYTVGWICALEVEQAAARALLDQEHPRLPPISGDHNRYRFGSINGHNVVIACLPDGETGNNPAATVAARMPISFPSLKFGLMVGIGGGVPTPPDYDDIRLGDVVVSSATSEFGGVIQYDRGKMVQEGVFRRTGSLNRPPEVIRQAVTDLRATHRLKRGRFTEYLSQTVAKFNTFASPIASRGSQDILFTPDYYHLDGLGAQNCESCDVTKKIQRSLRSHTPMVHYGVIASGNQLIRDGLERDRISRELGGALCFEMEAAGLMNIFPCLVIRGISDYSDSHKNKSWQAYAAAVAAAYAKELLGGIEPAKLESALTAAAVMNLPLEVNKALEGPHDLDNAAAELIVQGSTKLSNAARGSKTRHSRGSKTGKGQTALKKSLKRAWPYSNVTEIPPRHQGGNSGHLARQLQIQDSAVEETRPLPPKDSEMTEHSLIPECFMRARNSGVGLPKSLLIALENRFTTDQISQFTSIQPGRPVTRAASKSITSFVYGGIFPALVYSDLKRNTFRAYSRTLLSTAKSMTPGLLYGFTVFNIDPAIEAEGPTIYPSINPRDEVRGMVIFGLLEWEHQKRHAVTCNLQKRTKAFVKIELDNGTLVDQEAWVYVWNRSPVHLRPLREGWTHAEILKQEWYEEAIVDIVGEEEDLIMEEAR